jgi:predicted enzyme related to lactoylglutathione lyase
MPAPNLVLLYVDDPVASADFYAMLFDRSPAAVHPTYAAFAFDGGLYLGLWSTKAKNFLSSDSGHRSEIAFMVPDDEEVRRLHGQWAAASVTIEQPLHEAVFGLTFVALDPDGHRIRVCTPDP